MRQGGYADSMEVMFIPSADYPEPYLDVDLVNSRDHVPPGTTVVIGRDTNRYMVCADRGLASVRRGASALPVRAEYTWAQMGELRNLRVVRFGAPT